MIIFRNDSLKSSTLCTCLHGASLSRVIFTLFTSWNCSCNLFSRSVQLWTCSIWLTTLKQSKAWPPRKLTATLGFWSSGTCATYKSICPINESSDSFVSPLNTSGLFTNTFWLAWADSALPDTRFFGILLPISIQHLQIVHHTQRVLLLIRDSFRQLSL